MKTQSRQQGFAVLQVTLIVVVIAILGFTGWFVLHSEQAANKTLNNANKTSQGSVAKVSGVANYAACKKAAGSKLLQTYPAQCVTKDGKRFTDPAQAQK